ncbi:hypothetical protein E2C01_047759 [Portunus trituberculatus]|uniref:Uncharacterized protein n=1 Tax=Portunus trituberculatus TaxID=210409 RepID=A0A5B7G8R4_PORTR|nr:hypothetical protein [Portunus trituberculatus]
MIGKPIGSTTTKSQQGLPGRVTEEQSGLLTEAYRQERFINDNDMKLSVEVAKNDGPKNGSISERWDISDLDSHVMNPLCLPTLAKHQQDTNTPHEGGNSECCTGNTS